MPGEVKDHTHRVNVLLEKDNSKENNDNNGEQVDRGHLMEEDDIEWNW